MKHRGFTLIEAILYLALFSILITGALEASFGIFESGGHSGASALLAEEGSFVISKVRIELSGVTQVVAPAQNTSGVLLTVIKPSGTSTLNPTTLVGGSVYIKSVSFYHAAEVGTGLVPESVGMRIVLSTRTSKGDVLSQEFFSTTSLRK